jgi:2-oxoglutarate ferredoxin oxidoreductase subunit beta
LSRSFGFNGLHGRMPSLATGAMFGDITLKGIGVSGDGDTASIGMGQFKHILRRNLDFVYIVENNGVYGLTKGQFSATAERGLELKYQGTNPYSPIDICAEAILGGASFVARSFAGDPKQVKDLIKAAISHKGVAVLDIISPCVTFNNDDHAMHSYGWAKDHEAPLHDLTYIPPAEEIMLDEEMKPGEIREVELHDGSQIILKQVERDFDPTDREAAMLLLEQAYRNHWLITGLLYVDTNQPTLADIHNLPDEPLNRLSIDRLRPEPDTIHKINDMMF